MPSHGGKRLGSGRKSKLAKELGNKFFAEILSLEDLKKTIRKHIASDNEKISFDAAMWVADHLFGKAPQEIKHDGEIEHRVVSDL